MSFVKFFAFPHLYKFVVIENLTSTENHLREKLSGKVLFIS